MQTKEHIFQNFKTRGKQDRINSLLHFTITFTQISAN